MVYSEKYYTKWHDCDASRAMRPSAILTYFEETANLHMKNCWRSLDEIRDTDGLAFILSRLGMRFYEPVPPHCEIEVQTWTCEGGTFSTNRCFRMLCNGRIVAEGSSVWALVDLNLRRPVKVSQVNLGFEHEPPIPDFPTRTVIPKDAEFSLVGTRHIGYSDIDYNLHMNNTRYPDMLCDFIPDILNKRVRSIQLSFIHEATFGHELEILYAERDGVSMFRTVDGGSQTCLEACVQTESI